MLDFLRNNKESLGVKIVLGLIAFVLIIFFGADTLNTPNNGASEFARVNGEPLLTRTLDYQVNQRLDTMRKQYNMTEVPDNIKKIIRNQMQESLVQGELLKQEASRLGVGVVDSEVSEFIKEEFKDETGQFARDFYLNKFRPYYQMAAGRSYEVALRQQLATNKLFESVDSLYEPTEEEVLTEYNVANTKSRFTVVKVPKLSLKNIEEMSKDDTKKDGTPKEDTEALAKAAKIYEAWKKSGEIKKIEKEFETKSRITGYFSVSQLKRVFGGQAEPEEIRALLKLNKDNPFPEQVFDKENYIYLVKLDDQKLPEKEPKKEDLDAVKTRLTAQVSNALQSAILKNLTTNAEIEQAPSI